MPSPSRQKSRAKPSARKPAPAPRSAPKKAAKPAAKKPGAAKERPRPAAAVKPSEKETLVAPVSIPIVRRADGRVHVLSLSFVRDGDEFMARMESDAGQITELKNRSLDQLLTLVASELEDLLE
jgi:hypothetical protein